MERLKEVVLRVGFGPASTPVLPRAVEFAAEHADSLERAGEATWVATFRLGRDEERYGRALQLTCMAYGWKATTFEVDGSPEYPEVIREMLHCARGWLHRQVPGHLRRRRAAQVPGLPPVRAGVGPRVPPPPQPFLPVG